MGEAESLGHTYCLRAEGDPQGCSRAGNMNRGSSGWQPMTTAPRDGTRVLVWSATEAAYHVLSFDKTPPPGWMSQEGDYVVFEDQEPLSHWMALPSPPTTATRSAPWATKGFCAALLLGAAMIGGLGVLLQNTLDLLP